jgi:membrane protein implicated in regulation of membrane protease activity
MIYDPWHLWAAAALFLLIAEVFVSGLILGCLAIGAVGGAVGELLGCGWEGSALIASLTSIIAFVFVRPFAMKKWFSGDSIKTGVDALIGRHAEITTEINSSTGYGRCKIDGDDWKMKISDNSHLELKTGDRVEIVSVESAILIVKHPTN